MSDRLHECEVCHATVGELRRGRCWGCYARWVDSRPVGAGAKCIVCPEKRRRVLRAVELFGSWRPMCFNCSGQLRALSPMPATIAELQRAISRERRAKDRRWSKPDSRVFRYERRVGERRDPRETLEMIDDDMIIEVFVEDASPGLDFECLTSIHKLVGHSEPVELGLADLRG